MIWSWNLKERFMFHWQEQWKVNSLYSNTAEKVGFIQHSFLGSPRIYIMFLSFFPQMWYFTYFKDHGQHCLSYFYIILSCSVIHEKGFCYWLQFWLLLNHSWAFQELLSSSVSCLLFLLCFFIAELTMQYAFLLM